MTDSPPDRRLVWLAAGVVVLVVGHLPTINAPYVNQEWVFAEGARGLFDPGRPDALDKYWANQANPLGYSFLAAGVVAAAGPETEFWPARVPSLVGGFLLLFAGYRLSDTAGPQKAWCYGLWVAVTLSNPLVWCYSGQATADVLPAAAGLWAGAEALRAGGRVGRHLAVAALIGISSVVKYNCLIIIPGLIFAAWVPSVGSVPTGRRLAAVVGYVVLPAAVAGTYLAWVRSTYGIWGLTDRLRAATSPAAYVGAWPAIALMYVTFLTMLLGGLAVLPVTAIPRRALVPVAAGVLLVSAAAARVILGFDLGEMDLGGFDRLLPGRVAQAARTVALALSLVFAAGLAVRAFRPRARTAGFVAATVFPYLAVASASRPAQRYLLLIFPLVVWYVLTEFGPRRRVTEVLAWLTIVPFAVLSGVGTVYLAAQGRAADRTARWVVAHADPAATDPGILRNHAGQYFPVEPPADSRYAITTTEQGDVLHREPMTVFGRPVLTFFVVRLPTPGMH